MRTIRWPRTLRMIWTAGCVALIGLAGSAGGQDGKSPQAADLIDRFEQSVKKLECLHIEISETLHRPPAPGAPEELAGGNDFDIFRDGANWRCTVHRRALRQQKDGSRVESRGVTEYVVEDFFLRIGDIDQPDRPASKKLRLSGSLGRPKVEGQFLRDMLGMCSVIFGVLPSEHNLPLAEVLRQSESKEVLKEPDSLDGVMTRVLRATGPHGTHTIWFDLNAGCLPRRIEVRTVVNPDEGKKARGRASRKPRPAAALPKERLFRFDNIQIQNQDETFVITGVDHSRINVFEDREEVYVRHRLRGKLLGMSREGWPERPFSPTVEIPNGTPVRVEEEPTIDYAWNDGKIEKVIKKPDTEGASFRGGSQSRWGRKFVLIANGAFVFILGGVFVWRSRRAKSAG